MLKLQIVEKQKNRDDKQRNYLLFNCFSKRKKPNKFSIIPESVALFLNNWKSITKIILGLPHLHLQRLVTESRTFFTSKSMRIDF